MKNTTLAYLGMVAIFFASCAKENDNPSQSSIPSQEKVITDKRDQKFIKETIDKLPSIAIYNENIDQYILLNLSEAKNGFNFASPGGGFSFSSPGGTYEFVEGPDGSYYQIVTPGSSGGGGGGGVVTAGDVALSVNYVLCFSSGEETGADFFEFGEFSGFSGAVGIAGNFEALAEMSEEELEEVDIFDIFQGFVAYYAFDGTADGSYDIINFFDAAEEGEDFLQGNALAFLVSFQEDNFGLFFSIDGSITFSGSSVGFEGTYWGVTDDLDISLGDDVETDEDAEFVEVDGFGTLNCL